MLRSVVIEIRGYLTFGCCILEFASSPLCEVLLYWLSIDDACVMLVLWLV